MGNFVSGIISLAVSVVILATVFITTVKNTNTSGWSSSEIAMWSLITLVAIVGMVYGVLNVFGLA